VNITVCDMLFADVTVGKSPHWRRLRYVAS